tara:strand:- start:249 stop:542 length:294 start_codon:yes stop_codon:yes gene_type:complete
MKDIIEMSEGNPGALTCLLGIMKFEDQEDLVNGIKIITKLKTLNIKGTDIYVLWSDLSNKDYSIMANICENCPDEILVDACSRQDYSGIELVKNYIS